MGLLMRLVGSLRLFFARCHTQTSTPEPKAAKFWTGNGEAANNILFYDEF